MSDLGSLHTFSILTPVKNRGSTIAETLRSISAQSGVYVEHWLKDGGSTDNTLDVYRSWVKAETNKRIQSTVLHGNDAGLYDALNTLTPMVVGDFVGVLHSDDVLVNEGVLRLIAEAFVSTGADLVCCGVLFADRARFPLEHKSIKRAWMLPPNQWLSLRYGSKVFPPHTGIFVRRDIYTKYFYYNTDYKIVADTDILIRLCKRADLKWWSVGFPSTCMSYGGISTKNKVASIEEEMRMIKSNQLSWMSFVMHKLWKLKQFRIPATHRFSDDEGF